MNEEDEDDVLEEEEVEDDDVDDEIDSGFVTASRVALGGSVEADLNAKGGGKSNLKEIGDEATWILSSAKSGNGAEQLRDGSKQTFWQSDGTHPHTITVLFHRRVALALVSLYLDFKLDESYTPKKVKVLAGPTRFDLKQVAEKDFSEPMGWVYIPLSEHGMHRPLRTFCLQISFVSMHQNGRDTHVRLVRLYGPTASHAEAAAGRHDPMATVGHFSTLR